MRVDVIGEPETMGAKKTMFQPLAVYYPSKRLPVEDKLFIANQSEALPVGSYIVDVEKCLEPDSENYNRGTLFIRARNMVAHSRAQPSAVSQVKAG